MAPRSADPGAGQSQSGNHAGGGGGGPPRRDDLHRALGLSQPGQQRAVFSLYLPRRARRRRLDHQRGDEARRGQRHRRTGARGAVRRGGARLWRRDPAVRQGVADPRRPSIRASSCAWRRRWRRRRCESGVAHAADRRSRRLCRKPAALRVPLGLHHAADFRRGAQEPEAGHLCRWRGRAGAARRPGGDRGGHRQAHPDRPPRR